jgi:SAM-dependent methyltransferase
MKALRWAVDTMRQRGALQAWRIARSTATDLLFDLRYGTDTMRWVEAPAITTASEQKRHAGRYQATKERPLLQLLDRLELPKECTFVDIGSGKGRVLLIASQRGFRCVRGIEFSGDLCRLARRNVDIFSGRRQHAPIDVIEADATRYQFRADECVFFMYNPFDGRTLAKVLDSLRRSFDAAPRQVRLIYNVPDHHDIVVGSGLFDAHERHDIDGNLFIVYRNAATG